MRHGDALPRTPPTATLSQGLAEMTRAGLGMTIIQAIILSMTPQERRHPELIKGSRRLRIAQGSGTNVQAVKQLIKQFEQMRKVMRQVSQGRMPDLGALMRQGR